MKNKTLIFNYYGMTNVGGIEKYINEVTKELLKTDIRIIWLKERKSTVAKSFQNNLLESSVEVVEVTQKGYHWFSMKKIDISPNEEVTIVSFSPLDMGRAIYIAKGFSQNNVRLLYAIPNTTGNTYFIERYFKNPLRKFVAKRMEDIFAKWEKAGALVFFSQGQIKPLEEAYHLTVSSKNEKVLPDVKPMLDLDKEKLIKRSKRKPFKIITVGRFDFPHKNYMLGLIKIFGKLKVIYPSIKLDIIGFGPDELLVKREVENLGKDAQADIRLLGEVAPENLSLYFDDASLNISVAGGAIAGVELGVLSIPARNYCYEECEVYGFLPESKSMTTATSPGMPAELFIKKVIEMEDEEYIARCIGAYDEYKKTYTSNPYFFLENGAAAKDIYSDSDVRFLKLMHYMTKSVDYLQAIRKRQKGFKKHDERRFKGKNA